MVDINKNYVAIYECTNSKAMQYKVRTDSECELLKLERKVLLKLENDLKIKKEETIEISKEIIE